MSNIILVNLFLVLFLKGIVPSQIHLEKSPVVVTSGGALRGEFLKSRSGRPYFSFKGIPYGFIPERFEPSVEASSWRGTRDALGFGGICPQKDTFLPGINKEPITSFEEDCLFANIYVPETRESNKTLPIYVFIYGGAFRGGDSNSYQPDFFMDHDLILVTFNYRINILGFLSTDDGTFGNAGFKDQVLLLRWIQKNAEYFGGDPKRVTIGGESAGSASVNYLLLSPMAQGLFQNAIMQSGVSINLWAYRPTHRSQLLANLGARLQCPELKNTSKLIKCLKDVQIKDLLEVQEKLRQVWRGFPISQFLPSIESPGESSFLTQNALQLLRKGHFNKVNVIIGFNEDEGLLDSTAFYANEGAMKELNENWEEKLPIILQLSDTFGNDPSILRSICSRIRAFYFGQEQVSKKTYANLTNLFSDAFTTFGLFKTSSLLAKGGSRVYGYYFTRRGPISLASTLGFDKPSGPTHLEELQYQFNGLALTKDYRLDSESEEFSKNFVKTWASFVQNGHPTSWGDGSVWKPLNPEERFDKFLQIDQSPRIINLKDKYEERFRFWDEILEEFGSLK